MSERSVPSKFAYLFWNADVETLDVDRHGLYIASRLLMADDVAAWGLAVENLSVAGRWMTDLSDDLADFLPPGTAKAWIHGGRRRRSDAADRPQ